MGAPSRWIVAPCPGELGGINVCKEREKHPKRMKDGGAIGVRYVEGGGGITQLKQGGRGEAVIKLYKSNRL